MRPRSLAAPFLLSLCLLAGGCSQSFFRQSISEALQPATPEQVAAVHQPQALRDDLDALVKLHDDACPDPYLRTRWDTILATRDRLKASITAPMHRREFLPLVMEMQAAYGVDHIVQYPPQEDLLAYVARPKDWQKGKTYPVFVGAEGAPQSMGDSQWAPVKPSGQVQYLKPSSVLP